jgi:hypothetical protein
MVCKTETSGNGPGYLASLSFIVAQMFFKAIILGSKNEPGILAAVVEFTQLEDKIERLMQ